MNQEDEFLDVDLEFDEAAPDQSYESAIASLKIHALRQLYEANVSTLMTFSFLTFTCKDKAETGISKLSFEQYCNFAWNMMNLIQPMDGPGETYEAFCQDLRLAVENMNRQHIGHTCPLGVAISHETSEAITEYVFDDKDEILDSKEVM